MENVTDQKLLEILADPSKTRTFFSQKENLTALVDREDQRRRLASLITTANLDMVSISKTIQSLTGGSVSLVAPR